MPAANSMSIKRETLNLRIKPAERDLIDRAAKARGKPHRLCAGGRPRCR